MKNEGNFLRSADYDNILNDILNEPVNRFGLSKAIFQNHREINQSFYYLMNMAIDRMEAQIYQKYVEVLKWNPNFRPIELNPLSEILGYFCDLEYSYLKSLESPEPETTVQPEQPKRKKGRPPGKNNCLEDYLVDRENDNYIIQRIKDEYKNETLKSIYYCILVLVNMGKFKGCALENKTILSKVIKVEFEKGTRSNLNNVISGITKYLENDTEYQTHKERISSLLREKEIK